MANREETQEDEEERWEERTLSLLNESKIDQQLLSPEMKAKVKVKVKSGKNKKNALKRMRRPMVIPGVIIELQDHVLRENALRCLSNFLLEKRMDDPENYYRTGYLLFHSCSTMSILLQELLAAFRKMVDGTLNVRSAKRLANVLTLLQSIAANNETRKKFADSNVPNFLIPIIKFKSPLEVFQNVQAIALSVFGILCQARDGSIVKWAIESDVLELCQCSMEFGNELSKVVAMHILEAILQDESGLSYICSPACSQLLEGLMKAWEHLLFVNVLSAENQDFSPRLFFHIIRCYVLLCNELRGFEVVVKRLPFPVTNGSFREITEEFPIIDSLLQQLLVSTGKETEVPEL
ncbi:hypothetical protein Sjap_010755 [Stephania japonica]|uniref:Cell differentiation protein rcd1 n=1 Tax=Stephania japonica TaxID=461633 RepID=A0AAP0P4F8_9MAGN